MKKSTKIIGAVLGVLLVAALFTGAGAAVVTIDPIVPTAAKIVNNSDGLTIGSNTAEFTLTLAGLTPNEKFRITFDGTVFKVHDDLDYNFSFHGAEDIGPVYHADGATAFSNEELAALAGLDLPITNEGNALVLTIPKIEGEDAAYQIGKIVLKFRVHPEIDKTGDGTVTVTSVSTPAATQTATVKVYPAVVDVNFVNTTGNTYVPADKSIDICSAPGNTAFNDSDGTTIANGVSDGGNPALLKITPVANKTGFATKSIGAGITAQTINVYIAAYLESYTTYVAYDGSKLLPNKTWYLVDPHHDNPLAVTVTTLKTADGKVYFPAIEEEGVYADSINVNTAKKIMITNPAISAKADVIYNNGNDTYTYELADAFVPKDNKYKVQVSVINPTNVNIVWQLVDANNSTKILSGSKFDLSGEAAGEYTLVPYFDGYLVTGAPDKYNFGKAIPFTLGKADDEKIVLSAEKVTLGSTVVATVSGKPGVWYTVTVSDKNAVSFPTQRNVTPVSNGVKFQMGAAGVFDISAKTIAKKDEVTFTLSPSDKDATLEITDGILTAESVYEAYTIGDDIELFGTYTSDSTLYFYIEGINVPFTQIAADAPDFGYEWEATFKYADIIGNNGVKHGLDAGTYTIYVATNDVANPVQGATLTGKDYVLDGTYVTVPVVLQQSFITIVSAPTVVAQGEKIVIEGTANAAKSVMWYIFGTNYFETGVKNVKDDMFTIKIEGTYTDAKKMAAGQYFLVIQHPMYDGLYSIAAENMAGQTASFDLPNVDNIKQNTKYGVYYYNGQLIKADKTAAEDELGYDEATDLFSNNARQTPNAAEALCRALDSQLFDDMYAKASFIVGAPTSTINPIPATIEQGKILTVSGTTTGHKGDIVTVEFRATAFAALPKEAVGTAAFVTVNTKVQDDGTWAIDFDTSNLNCDEYTVSAAVGQLGPTTAKITVTKAGEPQPTVQPTGQPTVQPTTQPTATPATPGFGILAALAGLGAVAVLLLRRQ